MSGEEGYEDVWDHEPATDHQLAFLNRLGIGYADDITKGAASDLISERLENRKRVYRHSILGSLFLMLILAVIVFLLSQAR